jgi:hypothetical protein
MEAKADLRLELGKRGLEYYDSSKQAEQSYWFITVSKSLS